MHFLCLPIIKSFIWYPPLQLHLCMRLASLYTFSFSFKLYNSVTTPPRGREESEIASRVFFPSFLCVVYVAGGCYMEVLNLLYCLFTRLWSLPKGRIILPGLWLVRFPQSARWLVGGRRAQRTEPIGTAPPGTSLWQVLEGDYSAKNAGTGCRRVYTSGGNIG